LINYIRNERSQELYAALIRRLKMTNAVNKTADVNARTSRPERSWPPSTANRCASNESNERTKAYVYKLEMRVYAVRKDVLDRRINDLLIVAEANKRRSARKRSCAQRSRTR